MGDDNSDLKTLEALLDEFFSGAPALRQREIEQILLRFGSQRGSWGHCLNFLSRTSNQFVSMFCLTTIETVVNRQWQGLPWEERVQLKSALNNYTLQNHKNLPPFLRNKLVKLIVDIARHDWPHFYPEFFDTTLQLIHSADHCSLGLVFALTASEELVSPREDLSSSRKDELKRLLLLQVPNLFRSITGVLYRMLEKQKTRTSTPPPSPTHGQIDSSAVENSSPSDSLLLSGMIAAKLGVPGSSKLNQTEEDSHAVCSLALKALAQYLSWVPLDAYLTPDLIKILFQYVALPEHAQVCGDSQSLGVQAMCAINELLYKQCVPAEWHDLLLEMFGSVFNLLQKLISNSLDTVEEVYLEKFSEFLRVFVANHLHRFEGNQRFPMSEFLNLLLRFTFQQPTFDGQLVCLELWLQLISYLSTRVQDRAVQREAILSTYREALLNLLSHVINSIQFKYNQAKLEELDDETMDSDDQTEWQHYLCQHIETISKISELFPMQTYSMVLEAWESSSVEYFRLGSGASLQEHEASRLHCVLHDLSSLSQALGRLCDGLETEPTAALAVAERLVNLAAFGAQTKMYLPTHCPNPVLQPDLLAVHAQALAALKAWAPWLGEAPAGQKLALECIRTSVNSLSGEPPPLVAHAAAHLLVSLTAALRSPSVSDLAEMQALMQQAPNFPSLPFEDKKLVLRSLGNTLLLPWTGVIDQQWPQRQSVYTSLIGAITSQMQNMPAFFVDKARVPEFVSCLQLLTDQVNNLSGESSQTKRILAACVAPPVTQCLELFENYVNVPEACEALLEIFLAVFNALQAQLGAQYVERMAQVFLDEFTGLRLSAAVLQLDYSGSCVIDKFLKILQLIIQEPSQAFKRFVPSIMNLCMDQIYPIVCERPSPDVKVALLELLAELVLHNWRLFFKGNMKSVLLGKENSDPESDPVEHKDQLIRILRAFGQCLLQSDPAAFKVSLESLEKLNSKCKLYQKAVFKEELLSQFLTVLVQSLVEKNHGLLQDEVVSALYSMASVDFEYFYLRFIPIFLTTNNTLDDSQRQALVSNLKPESDLPSFSQGILRLVNDLHCYQLCNASLPEGSIRL